MAVFSQGANSNNVLLRILSIHINTFTYYTKFKLFCVEFSLYVSEVHKLYKNTGLRIKSHFHILLCLKLYVLIENRGDSK